MVKRRYVEIIVNNTIKIRNKVLRLSYQNLTRHEITSVTEIPTVTLTYLIDIGHENLLRPIIMRELEKFANKNGQNRQGRATIAKKWGVSEMFVRSVGQEILHYKS